MNTPTTLPGLPARIVRAQDRQSFDRLATDMQQVLAHDGTSSGLWCDPDFLRAKGRFSEKSPLLGVVLGEDSELRAVVPLETGRETVRLGVGLWRPFKMRVRMARLVDFEFPARDDACRRSALAAAVRELTSRGLADVVQAQNCKLAADTPVHGAMVRHRQSTYVIRMPATYDAYMATRSSNTRQILRRKARHLEKKTGRTVRLRCFRDPSDMAELKTLLDNVWGRSWHGRLGMQRPPGRAFLLELSKRHWIRAYGLYLDDEPIASLLGYQYRDTFYDEAPAYDNAWRVYSPGTVLNHLMLQDLFRADPPSRVDFGFGYNQYKEMLGTRAEERGELWFAGSAAGRRVLLAARACDALYRMGKMVLGKTAMARRIKLRVQRKD